MSNGILFFSLQKHTHELQHASISTLEYEFLYFICFLLCMIFLFISTQFQCVPIYAKFFGLNDFQVQKQPLKSISRINSRKFIILFKHFMCMKYKIVFTELQLYTGTYHESKFSFFYSCCCDRRWFYFYSQINQRVLRQVQLTMNKIKAMKQTKNNNKIQKKSLHIGTYCQNRV